MNITSFRPTFSASKPVTFGVKPTDPKDALESKLDPMGRSQIRKLKETDSVSVIIQLANDFNRLKAEDQAKLTVLNVNCIQESNIATAHTTLADLRKIAELNSVFIIEMARKLRIPTPVDPFDPKK